MSDTTRNEVVQVLNWLSPGSSYWRKEDAIDRIMELLTAKTTEARQNYKAAMLGGKKKAYVDVRERIRNGANTESIFKHCDTQIKNVHKAKAKRLKEEL